MNGGASILHDEPSTRSVSAEQFDSQFFAHQPVINGHTSNIATAHLPPVNRDAQPSVRSYGSTRMAFGRRSKRGDLVLSRSRRGVRAEYDDSRSADDPITGALRDEPTVVDSFNTNTNIDYQSDGSIKKRNVRTEHASWVRAKFDLDDSESLLDSCSAALMRKIMLQGRLHITSTCICFYAKIFGSVTKEKWPFTSIQSVRKRRGGFVANSIKISFVNPAAPSVVIASLNRRDAILAVIASRLSVLSPSSGEMTSRTGSGEGDSEDHSDGLVNTDGSIPMETRRMNPSNGSTPMTSDIASRKNSLDDHLRRQPSESSVDNREESNQNEAANEKEEEERNPYVDNLVWYREGDPMGQIKGKEWAKRIEQVRDVFRVPVVVAFNALFLDDWMIATYLPACNNFELQSSEWYKDEKDGSMRRDVTFRRPLRYRIGPKETRCEEIQRYCFTANGGVLIEVENVSLDAPFGDYFRVESYIELVPTRNGAETEVIASLGVHFSKSTMLRSKIENGALAETKSTFLKLVELGKEHIAATVPKNNVVAAIKKYAATANGKREGQPHVQNKINGDAAYSAGTDENNEEILLARNGMGTKTRTASFGSGDNENLHTVYSEEEEEATSNSSLRNSRNSVNNSNSNRRHLNLSGVAEIDLGAPHGTRGDVDLYDILSMKLLRGIAVASLLLVTILLVFVLISFRRMKHEFRVLQAIVNELQVASASRLTKTCESLG